VTGPAGFGDLNLSYIAPAGSGRYLGYGSSVQLGSGSSVQLMSAASSTTTWDRIVMVVGPIVDRASSAWHATFGNGGNGAAAPTLFIHVQFKTGWDASLSGLLPDERALVQDSALTTMIDEAFKGYAVTAVLGTIEVTNKYNRQVDIDGSTTNEENGKTFSGFLSSAVHVGDLFKAFTSALNCDGPNVTFDEIRQKTGFSMGQLVKAFGRGIGATSAHEVGTRTTRSRTYPIYRPYQHVPRLLRLYAFLAQFAVPSPAVLRTAALVRAGSGGDAEGVASAALRSRPICHWNAVGDSG
jgi:hypothetical protein